MQCYDRIEAPYCMWLRVPPAPDLHSVIAKEGPSTLGMSAFEELQQSRKRSVERQDADGPPIASYLLRIIMLLFIWLTYLFRDGVHIHTIPELLSSSATG